MRIIPAFLLLCLSLSTLLAQKIEIDRVSDRIILLNEDYFRSVAVETDKGVVLIDTREPLEKMEEIKQLIKQEFNTNSFCYVINTHGCPEHILGNTALPNTPAIMNDNFFNRKKLYREQKKYIDSLEIVCEQTADALEQNENCSQIEQGKNWRKYCIKALKINPDITYSEKMNLYFEGLSIQMLLTGLGHGYSTFIYIPEERFLHVSTLNSNWVITKFQVAPYLDGAYFLPYQIKTLQDIISISDSLEFVVPSHGEPYDPTVLKQMLVYYTELYAFASESCSSNMNYDTFKLECNIEKRFPRLELLQNLNAEELERHNENVDWLWKYFSKQEN